MQLPRRARHFVFALVALLVTPVFPQGAAAEQTKTELPTPQAKPSFRFSRETVYPPDFEFQLKKLNEMKERSKQGNISQTEVGLQAHVVENLARQSTYLITLRSEGGTLGELVNTTSGRAPFLTLINAGEPSDLDAKLPAFTLQRVRWGTIIEVLSKLLVSQGLELSYSGGDSDNPAEAQSVICVLRRAGPAAGSQSSFAAISLSNRIFGGQTVDSITDIIQTAWKMDPKRDASALLLQFHPSTKILLVSGPAPAAAIAREVIENLPRPLL